MVEAISLTELPPRPPTPPRSSGCHLATSTENSHQAPLVSLDDCASASDFSPHNPTSSRTKRVNFSPLTSYIKPPATTSSKSKAALRALRPSNQCKPTKSILKSTCVSPVAASSDELQPVRLKDFPTMLESVIQQLAGGSPSSRSDAYKQLLGALSAYRVLPDEDVLVAKVDVLCQFIRRDISEISGTYAPQHLNLARHALNMLAMFVWKPEFSTHISEDTKTFFIDHSITSLKSPSIPKAIVNEYMRFLSVQDFPQRIMTSGKVVQLLSALADITDRVEGKAVVAQRLTIYERLLLQSRQVMASQANLWLDHLITGLFHNVKEIRSRAIKLGFQTCELLGPNLNVATALRNVFDAPLDDNSKFVTQLRGRLDAMISNGDSGAQVPHIWSIVILLLRSKRWPIIQWQHLKYWLLVIQNCFNCSDTGIKLQALIAWDRFVYALSSNESTSKEITTMLLRPVISQLERKRSDKHGNFIKQVFSSYYNILYYAFRPSILHERIDACWKEYVYKPFLAALGSDVMTNDRACIILSSLLWNPQPKFWEENRAMESAKLEPEELPRLDCKWIRSRLVTHILPVFESLFIASVWSGDPFQQSHVSRAWLHLLNALADASSKEITPSAETMQAVAGILGMFQRVWKSAPLSLNATGDNKEGVFFDRFGFLVRSVISSIGLIPLTDKLLLKTPHETFQMAHTPTHHRAQAGKVRAPIIHLLQLLCAPPFSGIYPSYICLLHGVVEMTVRARKSRSSQLDFLQQIVQLHLERLGDSPEPGSTEAMPYRYLWQTVARLVGECFSSFKTDGLKARDDSASRDYEKVVKILCAGTMFRSANVVHSEWTRLLDSLISVIRSEKGGDAVVPVIEELAGFLSSQDLGTAIACTSALLNNAPSAPSLEEQQPSKFNPTINKFNQVPHSTNPSSDVKLTNLINKILTSTYENLKESNVQDTVDFFEAIVKFQGRNSIASYSTCLEKLQQGLIPWVVDSNGHLAKESGIDSNILVAVSLISFFLPEIIPIILTIIVPIP